VPRTNQYQMIERYIPNKQGRAGLMYAGMPPAAKNSMIEAFIEDAMDAPSSRARKHYVNYQFLIGTTAQLGKGHQLTRASVVVLMEPQLNFKDEHQAFCRVRRIGQKNPVTYTYKLLDAGSKIEKQIQKNHEGQGGIHGIGLGPGMAGLAWPPPHRVKITMVGPIPKLPLDEVDEPPVPNHPMSKIPQNYSVTSLRSRGESRFREELDEEAIPSHKLDDHPVPYHCEEEDDYIERIERMYEAEQSDAGPSGKYDRGCEEYVPAAEDYMAAENIASTAYPSRFPPRVDSLQSPIAHQQQLSYAEHDTYRRGLPATHIVHDSGLHHPNRKTLIEPGTELPLRRTPPTSNSSLRSRARSDERSQGGSQYGSQHGSQYGNCQTYQGSGPTLHHGSHHSSYH
jgi:hypothetical protein